MAREALNYGIGVPWLGSKDRAELTGPEAFHNSIELLLCFADCIFPILCHYVVARRTASEMSNQLPLNSNQDTPHCQSQPSDRWTPDIEKNQLYYEYLDDHNDAFSLLRALCGYRENSLLGFASYVLFSILSFFSAAYYFWSLMPYEPSHHNPVSIVLAT
ncbi:uncharacterized protein BO72DRAFT_501483 [Aspergillus fijiensis CBS 313.89]|uniref:Uncharacterized protein n=1 Tax=Aspergillus fijiensis CBS 313.89 TaxID=1448319 RepID=A0A8G1VWC8_9EURO|nr:uncharacterized protein BO72DRAFT_501483 [Aspergillus fijiensis CBS 313.89]RAK71854.1 hypothetical protein BO72DRAFT_501483 [Aspergillus fijiensis CBS 313.89]